MSTTFKRSAFGERLIRHAMRDRARREHGDAGMRVSPMFDSWLDGVFPPIADATDQLVASEDVKPHDYSAAVNSSMVFGFNLLVPFRVWTAKVLGRALSRVTGLSLQVEAIHFEYYGSGDILAETAGKVPTEDEVYTPSDAAVIVRDADNRRGVILLEVKLSEGDFSCCSGPDSRGNRDKAVCESSEAFFSNPARCYLRRPYRASRDRRYWAIFSKAYGSVAAAFPDAPSGACPFATDGQQIMRNHALALGLVQSGMFEFARFGLLHHDDNPEVLTAFEGYLTWVAEPDMLFRLPAGELIGEAEDQSGRWRDWGRYMRERYMLEVEP